LAVGELDHRVPEQLGDGHLGLPGGIERRCATGSPGFRFEVKSYFGWSMILN
jgi:hypothetical protein